ncbi:MAG: hypothetical protein AAF664_18570 [Planctomycetota bacterium]
MTAVLKIALSVALVSLTIWLYCASYKHNQDFDAFLEDLPNEVLLGAATLVSIAVVYSSSVTAYRCWRFRRLRCEVISPIRLGSKLRAKIHWPLPAGAECAFAVGLECKKLKVAESDFTILGEKVESSDPTWFNRIFFEAVYRFDACEYEETEGMILVPVSFSVPQEMTICDQEAVDWVLSISQIKSSSKVFEFDFSLPEAKLVQTNDGDPDRFDNQFGVASQFGFPKQASRLDFQHVLSRVGGEVFVGENGSLSVVLPPTRDDPTSASWCVLAIVLAFGGFAIVGFGGVVGAGLTAGGFALATWQLFGTKRMMVALGEGRISYRPRAAIFGKARELVLADVCSVRSRQVTKSNRRAGHIEVLAELNDGSEEILLENAHTPLIAKTICDRLTQLVNAE